LQHLKVNERLQTLISQQLYTQSHPINRISKAGAAIENTIAAPAFDTLLIGYGLLNTKIAYTTAEKLTFEAFY